MTPFRAIILLYIGLFDCSSVFAVAANTDELDRYVGNYHLAPGRLLRITREGDRLLGYLPNGPPGTLKRQSSPGRFSLLEAPYDFYFEEDATGKIAILELTKPDGEKQRLHRSYDARAAAAPLRTLAVDAETSVNAHVYNRYERIKGADGLFKTETYVFGEGGFQSSAPIADKSIDALTFNEIARSIAPALAQQGYLSATDEEKTDLLVMIYWGATASDDHPAVIAEEMFDPTSHVFRDQINRENARVLGFRDELKATPELLGTMGGRRSDLISDLEESRYWVALVAVDFQTARTQKTIKPLWSVRYNIPSRGTNFTTALPQMTRVASHYFGRNSQGLVNRSTSNNQGKVELGEQKVLGVESEK